MEKKLETLLEIEEEISLYFKKMVLYIQFGKFEEVGDYVEELYHALELENQELNLKSFRDSELSLMYSYLEQKDFNELFFESDFSSQVRLSYQIQKEQLIRLQKKSLRRNLLHSEKNAYYKALFPFRLVESYMKCNKMQNINILTIDYIHTFYRLWYSTPGLEIPSDEVVTLSFWTNEKNTKEEEYRFVERNFLITFFELFVPCLEEIPMESLQIDFTEVFYKTYIQLFLEYYSIEETKGFFVSLLQSKEKKEYLLKLVNSFSKPQFRLVRGNRNDYNKED